ncbi:MAG: transposase [Candidatus Riflebacteria bacterium]|nr:transposase [Candidatus Riflebacteria bacterium]
MVTVLREQEKASAATKSRQQVIICVDDLAEKTRGILGGLSLICWNGGEKRVLQSVNSQLMVAVVGDTGKVILLDTRFVLPEHEGAGKQPGKKTEWFLESIQRLNESLKRFGVSLKGCIVSVDSAYAFKGICDLLREWKVPLVSQVHGGRVIQGFVAPGFELRGIAKPILETWIRLNQDNWKKMENETDVEYLRTTMESNKLGRIAIIARRNPHGVKFLFSTEVSLKAKTIHRAIRRRWKLERVFWDWKQRAGMEDIHFHDKEACLASWYRQLILIQALKDVAFHNRISVGELCRNLKLNSQEIFNEILHENAFSLDETSSSGPVQREVA